MAAGVPWRRYSSGAKSQPRKGHAEGFKEAAGDFGDAGVYRRAAAGNRSQQLGVFDLMRERIVLCTEIVEIRVSQLHSVTGRSLFPRAHDFLRIRVRKRAQ
jgi:hypothetical protein